MSVVLDESGIPIDAGNAAELVIRLRTENERLKADLSVVECRHTNREPDRLGDVEAVAHRLALELECLLLDTKDMAVVSKWWDSANEALEQWRALDQQPHISPLGMAPQHTATFNDSSPTAKSR